MITTEVYRFLKTATHFELRVRMTDEHDIYVPISRSRAKQIVNRIVSSVYDDSNELVLNVGYDLIHDTLILGIK